MHLGNVFSALLAWLSVRRAGGVMVLRMEDLDPDRCRAAYAEQLADDLRWLGLDWDEGYQKGGAHGPYLQSERTARYAAAFRALEERGLVYPCYCTRAERLAASAPPPLRRTGGLLWQVQTLDRRGARPTGPDPLSRLAFDRA